MSRSARRYLASAWLLAALALVFPWTTNNSKARFDRTDLDWIEQEKPRIVFIGNSMMGSRIDQLTLDRMGIKTRSLRLRYSYPPSWYLGLKNEVVAARHRPEKIFIFFNDDELTQTEWDRNPATLADLEKFQRFQEPDYERLMFGQSRGSMTERLVAQVGQFYADLRGPTRWAGEVSRKFRQRLDAKLPLVADGRETTNLFLRNAGRRPAADGELRRDVPRPTEGTFEDALERSWLPLIVNVAKKSGATVCFYRVKRAPGHRQRYWGPKLETYMASLRSYFGAQQMCFIDENEYPELSDAIFMTPFDDHVSPEARTEHTRWFARKFIEGDR